MSQTKGNTLHTISKTIKNYAGDDCKLSITVKGESTHYCYQPTHDDPGEESVELSRIDRLDIEITIPRPVAVDWEKEFTLTGPFDIEVCADFLYWFFGISLSDGLTVENFVDEE